MKHLITTTAILLATSTAINAQSASDDQTLNQAITDNISSYLEYQETSGLSVDVEVVAGQATDAAVAWNEANESAAITENVQLAADLEEAQGNVENLMNAYDQSQQYLNTANANLTAAKQAVVDKQTEYDGLQEEYDALEMEYHDTEAAYEFKVANLEGELEDTNDALDGANAKLVKLTDVIEETEAALDAANTDLVAAEAQADALMTMLDTVATQRDKAVLDRQEALDNLETANANLDLLTTELQTTETDFNALKTRVVKADSRPYKVMGDVLQVSKDNGTYSGNSYDIGKISSSTVNPGLYLKDYTEVSNIRIKGKYSEFNIATDLRLSKNDGNLAEFNSVIAEVKNVMYNEGYKDGYNDGFEDGYNVGYKDAVSDIKGN